MLAILPVLRDGRVIAVMNLASRLCEGFFHDGTAGHGSDCRAHRRRDRADTGRRSVAAERSPLPRRSSRTRRSASQLGDLQGRLVEVNAALAEMMGYSREEIRGHHFREFTTPQDAAVQERLRHEILEGRRKTVDFEKHYVHKDGTPFWVRNFTSVLPPPPGGMPELVVGVIESINDRKQAEERLRESEARYRLIANNVSDVVWSARWTPPPMSVAELAAGDLKSHIAESLGSWRFEFISPSIERVLGYTVEECMGDTPRSRMDTVSYSAAAESLIRALAMYPSLTTFRHTLEAAMRTKAGDLRWCEVTVVILRNDGEDPLQVLGIMRDATARHEAQAEALREQESLRRQIDLSERERRFLAYEIHDGFAQQLRGAVPPRNGRPLAGKRSAVVRAALRASDRAGCSGASTKPAG